MKRVYKYELPVRDVATIRLPKGADWLSVGCQQDELFLWCLVDPSETDTTERTFRIAGTGHDLAHNKNWDFIGSVMMHGGTLVFHIFEARQ